MSQMMQQPVKLKLDFRSIHSLIFDSIWFNQGNALSHNTKNHLLLCLLLLLQLFSWLDFHSHSPFAIKFQLYSKDGWMNEWVNFAASLTACFFNLLQLHPWQEERERERERRSMCVSCTEAKADCLEMKMGGSKGQRGKEWGVMMLMMETVIRPLQAKFISRPCHPPNSTKVLVSFSLEFCSLIKIRISSA